VILPVAALVVAVALLLTGGRLDGLARLRLRAVWAIAAALVLQLTVTLAHVPVAVGATLHLASYVLAAVAVVANRHVPGLWLIGLGGGLNLAAIAANGGVMPASSAALARAGLPPATDGFVNSRPVDGARLPWLGDVFAVPAHVPLANVFSVGDVLLVVGVAVLLVGASHAPEHEAPVMNPGRA
jgi:hypothetical protein